MSEDMQTLRGTALGSLQIFDLKQMAEKEQECRSRALKAIEAYKKWKRDYAAQTDVIELLYGNVEGIILRRQAEYAVRYYGILRHDFCQAFKVYMAQSIKFPTQKRAA